jgi:Bacterial SH3 domain
MKRLSISLVTVLGVFLATGSAFAQTAGTVKVTAPRANIRSGPNQKSPILARVSAGTTFRLQAVEGEWYRVQLPASSRAAKTRKTAFISRKVSSVVTPAVPAVSSAQPVSRPPAAYSSAPAVSPATSVPAEPTPLPPPPVSESLAAATRMTPLPAPPLVPLLKATSAPLAAVSRDGMSVALQTGGGSTWMPSSSARVSKMLEKVGSVPEFAKTLPPGEGSGAAATGTTPITYVWTVDGNTSRLVDEARPTFVVQYKDVPGVSPDEVIPVIVRLTPTGAGERFVGAAKGRADEAVRPGAEWDVFREFKQEIVKTELEKVGRGAAKVRPTSDLKPGDYAVVLRMKDRKKLPGATVLSQSGEGKLYTSVWPFTVR